MPYPELFRALEQVRWNLEQDVPRNAFGGALHAVRFAFDPAPPLEALMLHCCGEIRLDRWYRRAAEWHAEPATKWICELIAQELNRYRKSLAPA